MRFVLIGRRYRDRHTGASSLGVGVTVGSGVAVAGAVGTTVGCVGGAGVTDGVVASAVLSGASRATGAMAVPASVVWVAATRTPDPATVMPVATTRVDAIDNVVAVPPPEALVGDGGVVVR